MNLKFEYCECGCKGSTWSARSLDLWLYWDLLKNSWTLHRGHGWLSPEVGSYASRDKAIDAARQLISKEIPKVRKALEKMLDAVGEANPIIASERVVSDSGGVRVTEYQLTKKGQDLLRLKVPKLPPSR